MYEAKQAEILAAINSDPPDVEKLRQFAISPGGLVTDELRQKAWPILINVDTQNIPTKPGIYSITQVLDVRFEN